MRNEVKSIVKKLADLIEKVEEFKDNAEGADSPNDERIEKLGDELDLLEQAKDILEEIE